MVGVGGLGWRLSETLLASGGVRSIPIEVWGRIGSCAGGGGAQMCVQRPMSGWGP